MKARNSLSNKITLVFIFSILFLCMFFILLVKYQGKKNLEEMKIRQLQSINYIFVLFKNNSSPYGVNQYFSNFGLKQVTNKNLRLSVLDNGVVVFQKKSDIGIFSSILYNDRYYLYIDNMISNMLLESEYKKGTNNILWFGFVIALIILFSIYISILKSIRPLKTLSEQIRKFASGNMQIDCKSNKNDEIAEVANEFDKAASKLRDLINARQLFLRAIMHELKTPIGKGRIISEMLQDEKAKKRLVSIFERLDLLINEFSKIEKIVSKNYSLEMKNYKLVDVVDYSIDMLMLDEDKKNLYVHNEINNEFEVFVDFESFSMAIKNLLDNAIKYSDDKKVYIKLENSKLIVENIGTKFLVNISEYEKPFVSGKNELKKGLGLGLYIVKNIVNLNNFSLNYKHEDNKHKFIIDFAKEEVKNDN